MLRSAPALLAITFIAALLGFGGIAAGAAGVERVLFEFFLIASTVAFFSSRRTL